MPKAFGDAGACVLGQKSCSPVARPEKTYVMGAVVAKKSLPLLVAALMLAMQPGAAVAYIGPGVGLGAIGAVIGVIGSIILAIFAVVWYPIKRMMKARKKPAPAAKNAQTPKTD